MGKAPLVETTLFGGEANSDDSTNCRCVLSYKVGLQTLMIIKYGNDLNFCLWFSFSNQICLNPTSWIV